MYLTEFQSIRPPLEASQEETFAWFVDAHVQAETTKGSLDPGFREAFTQRLWQVGCKPEYIRKRGYVLPDFLHRNWQDMKVYRLHENAEGKDLSVRAAIYEEEADKIFEQYYQDGSPPDDLIHVSCTGYVSPSSAQKIVSKKSWGHLTTVTHAYHMGCYGSVPAVRIGRGFLSASPEKNKVDIVHTEICCLHINPSLHQLDQLVSQTLFADGFIKYTIVRKNALPGFKLLNVREEIIPHSTKAMTWNVAGWGFQMFLAKEVPVYITRYLQEFLQRLCPENKEEILFAIHPGGPKILLHVQKNLGLSDEQMRFSFQILKEYGNMSSATLPHIWERILQDDQVPYGTRIISLAFGPGLSIAGSLMEKVCGS